MKHKVSISLGVFIVVLLSSCGPKQFYEQTENGLEYYFFKKNKEAKMGQIGDIYNLNITATTKRDSLLFTEHAMFKRHEAIYPGDFHEGLGMIHQGDSIAFVLSVDSFFGMHDLSIPKGLDKSGNFKLLIGVEAILSPLEHLIYKSEQELVKMNEYIALKNWDITKDSTGIMYQIVEEQLDKPFFQIGDSALLSYTYSTLDGRIINKTRGGDLWRFEVGSPDSRVSGLSRILTLTKQGEKVRALIPFAEAFGEEGYGPIIPPYTTIVMELETELLSNE
jgi:FKBP-type peptidyl-prolyl cis-trans isomerase FkpA